MREKYVVSDMIGCRSQMTQGLLNPGKELINDNDSYDLLSMVSGMVVALVTDSPM